jgi:hypothetical protein
VSITLCEARGSCTFYMRINAPNAPVAVTAAKRHRLEGHHVVTPPLTRGG